MGLGKTVQRQTALHVSSHESVCVSGVEGAGMAYVLES